MKKIGAWIILFLLLVVPFIHFRTGAIIWMSAFLVYILQQVFQGNPFSIKKEEDMDAEKDEDMQR